MDPDVLKRNPLFGRLVSRVNEQLSKEKASPKVQKTFDQAQRSMIKSKSEWMNSRALLSEMHEVLTDLDVGHQERTLSEDEEKLRDVLTKTLIFAELPDYLRFSPNISSKSSLFSLSGDDIDRHNPVKTHQKELLQVVVPKLEEKLRKKCEALYLYFNPLDDQLNSEKLLTAKAHSLPAMVEEKRQRLAVEKSKLEDTRHTRDTQFWLYYQKLVECLSIMETLIKDIKCDSQALTNKITAQKLLAHANATCMKARSAILRLKCETYTSDAVKALRVISNHLDAANNQTKRELAATSHSLHTFRQLGPEFAALAAQVTQLKQELDSKNWGLQQFSSSEDRGRSGSGDQNRSPNVQNFLSYTAGTETVVHDGGQAKDNDKFVRHNPALDSQFCTSTAIEKNLPGEQVISTTDNASVRQRSDNSVELGAGGAFISTGQELPTAWGLNAEGSNREMISELLGSLSVTNNIASLPQENKRYNGTGKKVSFQNENS